MSSVKTSGNVKSSVNSNSSATAWEGLAKTMFRWAT